MYSYFSKKKKEKKMSTKKRYYLYLIKVLEIDNTKKDIVALI